MDSAEQDAGTEELGSPVNKEASDQEHQIEEENYSGDDSDVQDKNHTTPSIPLKSTVHNINLRDQID